MGFKHKQLEPAELPAEDHSACGWDSARLRAGALLLTEITVKGAWTGPGALDLHPHALAPVADLPVREIVSAVHIIADLTLPLGTVRA